MWLEKFDGPKNATSFLPILFPSIFSLNFNHFLLPLAAGHKQPQQIHWVTGSPRRKWQRLRGLFVEGQSPQQQGLLNFNQNEGGKFGF